jgi:hypothetical protein
MPAQRLAMRQVHEVLRLKWGQGLSDRKIAQSLGISRPAVAEYVRRAQAAGLSWPLPATCDERALERLLCPSGPARAPAPHLVPDWATVHHELKRQGVTLFLLWQEYKAATPDGFHNRELVATRRGPYPHRDGGVEVRRIFHKLRSLAIEPFNGLFKNIFEWRGQMPVKGLKRCQLLALGAILLYQIVLLYQHQRQQPVGVGVKALLRAA